MNRDCKGYLVDCKNPAVKGRLFCFTCAGRKSRNKKTQALESFERECEMLRSRITELEPELAHWKSVAMSLRISEIESRNQKPQQDPMLELSGAAEALLAFADQIAESAALAAWHVPIQLLMPAVDLIHNAAPAAEADVHAAATANPAPATRTSITKRARQDIGMSPLHTTAKRRCCTIHSGNTE
nr:hypothetical protein HK105_006758 [Polyrhizophydium stewartii]